MARPSRFEHHRYVGDKDAMVVYDVDNLEGDADAEAALSRVLASERFATFGPDTLTEARNRCYRPHRSARP